MKKVMKWLRKSQKGQTATEYILIIGVIVVTLIGVTYSFKDKFQEAVDTVGETVKRCVTEGVCTFGG